MREMMKKFSLGLLCLALLALSAQARAASQDREGFSHDSRTSSPAPIPFQEQGLQTVEAKALKVASNQRHILEGAAFDHAGNLYFCDVTAGKVQRLTPEKALSDHVILKGLHPSGLQRLRPVLAPLPAGH